MDSREKNGQLKGLRKIVVRTRIEPAQHVLRLSARRQHQHWNKMALQTECRDDAESVDARQHHVKNNEIVASRFGVKMRESLLAVVDNRDLVAFRLEVIAQPVGKVAFVFDE